MAWRALALVLAALPALAALGALAGDAQPSAQRVTIAATAGLLAPLLWPGSGPTAARTGATVLLWSGVAAGAAVLGMTALGDLRRAGAGILATGAMLWLVLLVTHAGAAAVELHARRAGMRAAAARELGGCVAALVLALLASLPLWAGPAAEALSGRLPGLADTVVGASPLTHLALASGNDLLRNQWFYQHANLAALPVTYPRPAVVAWAYAAVLPLLVWATWALQRRLLRAPASTSTNPDTENSRC